MRLGNLDFKALLPTWMQGDVADAALSAGVDETMWQAAPQLALLTVWDVIYKLPEPFLDELAWALDIKWYESGASLQTKQDLVLRSDRVHQKLGTVESVESVVASYFGDAEVIEWFDYAGSPHRFKVFTTDPTSVSENLEKFLDMLDKVKRLSSKFDGILIGLVSECHANSGFAIKETRTISLDWRYSQ